MIYDDLRSFIARLDEFRELHRITKRVEKDGELSAICRENFDRAGPALIFEAVGDYTTPLVTGVLGTNERYARALDIEPSIPAITEKWNQAYRHPIPPKEVARKDAPCKEVELTDIDLYGEPFPVPKWHPLDGGPEIGTLHAVITMDPESGWINVGTYRNEIFTKDTIGCYVLPNRHDALHFYKWRERGEAMPVCVALGLDPYVTLASASAVPLGINEYDIAGGLKGAPIEVVKADLSDLLVPARAEIILEGEMPIDDFWPVEGPFGEFPGIMGTVVKPSHYIKIKKITHRRKAMFQGTLEGRPPSESTTVRSLCRSAAMFEHLRRAGLPGIKDVSITPMGCAGFHCVVSIKKIYHGQVRDIFGHVWGHPTLFAKHCIVVDEDIDPWNPLLVEWAIATRVQADRDVEIVKNGKSIRLDPSQVPSRRGWSALMGIDATIPHEWYERDGETFPAFTDPRPEDLEKVRKQWLSYGFER